MKALMAKFPPFGSLSAIIMTLALSAGAGAQADKANCFLSASVVERTVYLGQSMTTTGSGVSMRPHLQFKFEKRLYIQGLKLIANKSASEFFGPYDESRRGELLAIVERFRLTRASDFCENFTK